MNLAVESESYKGPAKTKTSCRILKVAFAVSNLAGESNSDKVTGLNNKSLTLAARKIILTFHPWKFSAS